MKEMGSTPNQASPVVSVLMPLYNKGNSVSRAIGSVLSQNFRDFELIVVDDGSTDHGPEIVRMFADPRVRMIRQDNAGPGAARNRGIRESRAELVAFLDADDEWLPDFLACSLSWLGQHPDCDLSVSGFYQGAERVDWGQIARQAGITEGPWRLSSQLPPKEVTLFIGYFNSWAIVCKKWVVARYQGFYEKRCTFGEDTYLWLQVALNHRAYRSLVPLVWYHSENSELWLGSKDVLPPEPLLTDPEPLRNQCPTAYRPMLENWLTHNAAYTVRRLNRSGKFAWARWIESDFVLGNREIIVRLRKLLDMAQGLLYRMAPSATILSRRIFRKMKKVGGRLLRAAVLPVKSTPLY